MSAPGQPQHSRERLPRIDPIQLGQAVISRLSDHKDPYLDEPVIGLYNLGRLIPCDSNWGRACVSDVLGCNFRCAHCWVHGDALNARLDSAWVADKVMQFPQRFAGRAIHGADDLFEYLAQRLKKTQSSVAAFTGGEPTQYRAGIGRFAALARARGGIKVGVDTSGFMIADHLEYLDAWEGLQSTLSIYVSIKGATPEAFQRLTGVDPAYHDYPFIALQRLLQRGFFTVPGGIVLNSLTNAAGCDEARAQIARLHQRLTAIHPDLPRAVSCHKVTFGKMVHQPAKQSARMRSRGYYDTRPAAARAILEDYFAQRGTPLLESRPQNRGKAGIDFKKRVIERIIRDLR